jgi:hypothetical protein
VNGAAAPLRKKMPGPSSGHVVALAIPTSTIYRVVDQLLAKGPVFGDT